MINMIPQACKRLEEETQKLNKGNIFECYTKSVLAGKIGISRRQMNEWTENPNNEDRERFLELYDKWVCKRNQIFFQPEFLERMPGKVLHMFISSFDPDLVTKQEVTVKEIKENTISNIINKIKSNNNK